MERVIGHVKMLCAGSIARDARAKFHNGTFTMNTCYLTVITKIIVEYFLGRF